MENQFPSFPFIFTFLVFLFMVLRLWKNSKKNSAPNLPPGPWKLPVIGSMHHLSGSLLPHVRLRNLANEYGPLMHLKLGEVTNIVVSSPETAKAIMKTHDHIFAQRPFLLAANIMAYNSTDLAFAPYGDYWRQMRKICTQEILSAKRVLSFGLIREEEVSKFIRDLSSRAGSTVNFSRMFNSVTYNIIQRVAIGKLWKGEEIVIPAFKKLIEAAGGFSLSDLYPSIKLLHKISTTKFKLLRAHKETDKLFQNIIDEHRARKASRAKSGAKNEEEDIIDVLLQAQSEEELEYPITDDNIKAVIMDVLSGGTDTSATTVVWAMSELLKNPDVMKRVQTEVRQVFSKKGYVDEESIGELHYLKAVVKETMRLHPTGAVLTRECREDCVINGYDIPYKSRIIINAWALGRDPDYWPEAERFNPDRFLNSSIDYKGKHFEFLPFGAGRRICPGILFGISNVQFPLARLLYHFDWKLPNGMRPEDLDMNEKYGIAVRRANDLQLIPIPCFPPQPQVK
ncbi:hypothetical protein JCGZ_01044 [Jatropha curcas]|uniref:Cytochrome P450 n=2 Tax=Jatropha curcas TaxID=180498 RepID=A0A067KT39_JATCU|nr:hypothetical protein JCGZ_01044 [Jatropha curcas]